MTEFNLRLRPWPRRLINHYRTYRKVGFGRLRAVVLAWGTTWL